MEKDDVAKRAYDLAYEYESEYGSCPQCVMAAINDLFGIVPEEVLRAGYLLAGGGGICTDGTCGALVGGYMVLSSIWGRPRNEFESDKYRIAYKKAKILHDRFVGEFGSPLCCGVQEKIFGRSFDMWDPEDYQRFETMGGHDDKCPMVAGKAARWTAEILLENVVEPK